MARARKRHDGKGLSPVAWARPPTARPPVVRLVGPTEHVDRPMTDDEAVQVLASTCRRKKRYLVVVDAQARAAVLTRLHRCKVTAYRCPFGSCSTHVHWHVGRIPSHAQVERIALAMRHLAENRHLIA